MSKRLIKFFVCGLSILFIYSSAYADEIGRFTAVEGRVDILKSGEDRAASVIKGDVVSNGDIIRTKSLSKAEIKFADKTILRLAENTRVEIKEYILDGFGLRSNSIVNIQRGQIRAIVSKAIGTPNFFVNTPNASASVKGSDVFVFYQKSATGVLVKEGDFTVINNAFPDQPVDVSEGFMSIVPPDQPPQKPRPYLDVERKRHEVQTAALPAPVKDDPSQIKAVVIELKGEVKVKYARAATWRALRLHDVLGTGDEIKTEETGLAEIRLDNGNTIILRPNSTIILEKLSRDLKTGDYKNLFEANFGNIRAKVQKLKGDSKFEIRTPTAVAAVRGTTMYLLILPGLTKVFFEGGDGTLTSLISQISAIVGDGQTSSADDQGNVSDSTDATDEEKSGWTGGWDTGEAEGYSPPEEGLEDLGTEDEGDEGEGPPDVPDTGDGPGVYIPPDPDDDGTPPAEPGTTNLTGSVEGGFIADIGDPESGVIGLIEADLTTAALTPIWFGTSESGSSPVTIEGIYTKPEDVSLWASEVDGAGDDGGVFTGLLVGSWNSWKGALASIYIDSSGIAGTMVGYLEGTSDETEGTMTGRGDIFIIPMTETALLPGDLLVDDNLGYDFLEGTFGAIFDSDSGAGYINGHLDRYFLFIKEEPWGIWASTYTGEYERPLGLSEWSGRARGSRDIDQPNYFTSTVEAVDDLNGALRMHMLTTYLDTEFLGAFYGTVLGTYEESDSPYAAYYFEGIGAGGYVMEPLAWSGEIDAYYHYYDDSYDELCADTEHYGIMGATQSPFALPGTPVDITLMGETYPDDYITWWGYLDGSYVGDGSIIPDGFIGGRTNSIEGMLTALYIDDLGNAGTLSGNFQSGYYDEFDTWIPTDGYYDDLDMWQATGGMTATQRTTGYNPLDYDDDDNYIDGYAYGVFDSGGEFYPYESIYSIGYGELMSYTAWLIDPFTDNDEPWGIFNIELGGYFDYEHTSNDWTLHMGGDDWRDLDDEEYWFATVIGNQWSEQRIAGGLEGRYITSTGLGTIEGGVLGSYDTEDYDLWEAIALGTWQEEPLVSAGELYNTVDYFYEDIGYFGGYMGITGSVWGDGSNCDFTSIGDFSLYGEEPFVWHSECDRRNPYAAIYSYDPYNDRYTTYGDNFGAFYGITAGIGGNDELEGLALALYIDPDTNAGTLSGPINGFYSDDIEMYILEGELTNTLMTEDTGIPPEELLDHIDFSDIEGGGFGSFETGGDITAHVVEGVGINIYADTYSYSDLWGIWGTVMFGSYTGAASPSWQLDLSGVASYREDRGDYYFEETVICRLGRVNGTASPNRLDGSFNGIWIGFHDDKVLSGGTISSDVIGNYVEGNSGVWQAVCAGEWVTVEEELDLANLDNEIIALGGELVPVVKPYSSTMSGSGTFDLAGEIAALMDMSFYATSNLAPEGIWVSVIDGTYAGPTSPSWRLALGGTSSDENVDVCLLGTIGGYEWSDTDGWLGGEFRGVWFAPIE